LVHSVTEPKRRKGDLESARQLFEAALSNHGNALGRVADDVSRVPLLLDLVYVHASRKNWIEARAPFEQSVSLIEKVMRIAPEAFAAHLEQQGEAVVSSTSDWRERRRRYQAQAIRLMLEH
jgi:hypothetical protein